MRISINGHTIKKTHTLGTFYVANVQSVAYSLVAHTYGQPRFLPVLSGTSRVHVIVSCIARWCSRHTRTTILTTSGRQHRHQMVLDKIAINMTAASPPYVMPGAFGLTVHAGPKSNVFQPPQQSSSASSSAYLSRSAMSITSDTPDRPLMAGRKRSRNDYTTESNATPMSYVGEWPYGNGMDTSESMARSEHMDPGSPMPFVNTRYQLSGGLDTPGAAAAVRHDAEDNGEYAEIAYRKTLGESGDTSTQVYNDDPVFYGNPLLHTTARNGHTGGPIRDPYRPSTGWSRLAIDVVGTVVGKVWEFCKAGAFKGFSAGGGVAYGTNMGQGTEGTNLHNLDTSGNWSEKDDRESTPIPGSYIEDGYFAHYGNGDGHGMRDGSATPPRAAKRLQVRENINDEEGELGRNWIMVSETSTPTSRPSSASTRQQPNRYSMPTASSAGRYRTSSGLTPRTPASRATGRRPLMPARQSSYSVSHAGSPGLSSHRPASYASPRSPSTATSRIPTASSPKLSSAHRMASTSASNIPRSRPDSSAGIAAAGIATAGKRQSPASLEAQREALKWAAKKKREEAQTDESMRRLNQRLQDMIRQGREALGTKVEVMEVEGEIEDEGFEEGY
jgi:hypothetical protein